MSLDALPRNNKRAGGALVSSVVFDLISFLTLFLFRHHLKTKQKQ
jgi:hypothetical protein